MSIMRGELISGNKKGREDKSNRPFLFLLSSTYAGRTFSACGPLAP